MRKQQLLAKIEPLDAQRDHLAIAHWVGYHDFPWDTTRALEFALFRTFAIPSVGNLLRDTKEFTERTQKRYDDTDLLLSEIIEHGYDSENGRAALARMNKMHGANRISNEDMQYVLSTFVIEPYRWNLRFGYRISTQKELDANHRLWFEIGTRMGIKDIPNTFKAMEDFNLAYENQHFGYSDGGRKVADATINLMLGWFLPKFTWGMFRPFALAVMDDRLLQALGYNKPSWLVRNSVDFAMQARKLVMQFIPLRKKPKYRTRRRTTTYPAGYKIQELGTHATPKG
jgi:hypothetical protein